MFRALILASVLVLPLACKSHDSSASLKDDQTAATSGVVGGTLSVIVIPPALNTLLLPQDISWSTPNNLFKTSAASKAWGTTQVSLRKTVGKAHPIGHFHIKLDCVNGQGIQLTGQTGGGSEYASLLDGVGASFRIFPGNLDDDTPDELAGALADYNLRVKNGYVAMMRFKISADNCQHMLDFVAEYRKRGANKYYGGQFRPRRFEGAGCSAFGLSFVEIGGLLRRSLYTKDWSQNVNIGLGRISNVGGRQDVSPALTAQGLADYKFGSNFLSYDDQGQVAQWPRKTPVIVDAGTSGAIRPLSNWLNQWVDGDANSPTSDASVNKAAGAQPNVIPWTIYDPQLVYHWIQSMNRNGGGDAYGRTWTAAMEGKMRIVETDATDATPQPFFDPTDDLRKDPDYDHPDATDGGTSPTADAMVAAGLDPNAVTIPDPDASTNL